MAIKNEGGAKSSAADAARRAAEESRKRAEESRKRAETQAAQAKARTANKPLVTKAVAFKADEMSAGRGGALRASATKLLGSSGLASPKMMSIDGGGGSTSSAEWRATTTTVNLRSQPSATGNEPLALVPPGTSVKVTPDASGQTRKDGFVHVEWNDAGKAQSGWISEQYTTPSVDPATKPGPAAGSTLYT